MQKELTEEEKQVYDLIVHCNGRITQLEIARKAFVGCHDRFENYDNPKASTLRKVRQIIRDLRINHGLFILSDPKGYWIMKDKSEVHKYLRRMEVVAKASAKSYFDTYKAMQRNFGIKSEYFEKQLSLNL